MRHNFQRKKYRFNASIEKDLKLLRKLNNSRGIIALLEDYLIIILAIIFSVKCYFLYPLSVLIIGSRQRALTTLLHESIHKTLAKNKTLNYLLGTFFSGYLVFQSYPGYKNSHGKQHHAFLGDKDRDPDYVYHLKLGLYNYSCQKTKLSMIKKLCTYPIYLVKNRMSIFLLRNIEDVSCIIYILSILVILFKLGLLMFFTLYWIVPFFTSFVIIGWFIELAEHYPVVHQNSEDLNMSRNRFSHCAEGFFLSIHNENFHLIHHLQPGIPFWHMKKAHQILMQDANYASINEKMGGVFISSNKRKTVFSIFTENFFNYQQAD